MRGRATFDGHCYSAYERIVHLLSTGWRLNQQEESNMANEVEELGQAIVELRAENLKLLRILKATPHTVKSKYRMCA